MSQIKDLGPAKTRILNRFSTLRCAPLRASKEDGPSVADFILRARCARASRANASVFVRG